MNVLEHVIVQKDVVAVAALLSKELVVKVRLIKDTQMMYRVVFWMARGARLTKRRKAEKNEQHVDDQVVDYGSKAVMMLLRNNQLVSLDSIKPDETVLARLDMAGVTDMCSDYWNQSISDAFVDVLLAVDVSTDGRWRNWLKVGSTLDCLDSQNRGILQRCCRLPSRPHASRCAWTARMRNATHGSSATMPGCTSTCRGQSEAKR